MEGFLKDPDFQYLCVDRIALLKEFDGYDGKKACWIPDEHEGFTRGEIVSSKGEEITVKVLRNNEVSAFLLSPK